MDVHPTDVGRVVCSGEVKSTAKLSTEITLYDIRLCNPVCR